MAARRGEVVPAQFDSGGEALEGALAAALKDLSVADLYRRRMLREGATQPEQRVDGMHGVSFCSNDYLGLANHPAVVAALHEGADRYGVGSGGSHLLGGHTVEHAALERELAVFTGQQRALLFSTGYMANLGVLGALCGRGDTIIEDRLNHASLIDAALLAQSRLLRYPHVDAGALERLLRRERRGRTVVATDGVFSMDGDVAPLPALADSCRRHGAALIVDDAHGLGVLGAQGRGSLEACGLPAEAVVAQIGTFGKALGVSGAFVAGSEVLIETLVQRARPYIYTTAMPPACAMAVRAALRVVGQEPWRRQRLAGLVARFRERAAAAGLPLTASRTPIQPLVLGDVRRTLRVSAELRAAGFIVPAVRPPTVPRGSARLRITLSAAHREADVDGLVDALHRACR